MPLAEAGEAQTLVEQADVIGKIVLVVGEPAQGSRC
jgi:hypothetical protein